MEGLVGKQEVGAAGGQEGGVEQGVEGEQAEQEGDGFGEFEQHAAAPSEVSCSLLLRHASVERCWLGDVRSKAQHAG